MTVNKPEPDCDRVACIMRKDGKCTALTDNKKYEGRDCPFLCTKERYMDDIQFCLKKKKILNRR